MMGNSTQIGDGNTISGRDTNIRKTRRDTIVNDHSIHSTLEIILHAIENDDTLDAATKNELIVLCRTALEAKTEGQQTTLAKFLEKSLKAASVGTALETACSNLGNLL